MRQARKSPACGISINLPAGFAPAAAATTVPATAIESAAAAFRTWARFVHIEGPAVQFLTVEGLDRFRRFRLIGHFDKRKAAGLSGVPVADYAGLFHSAIRSKGCLKLRFRGLISKVSNKDVRH